VLAPILSLPARSPPLSKPFPFCFIFLFFLQALRTQAATNLLSSRAKLTHPRLLAPPRPAVDLNLTKVKTDEYELLKLLHRIMYRTPGKQSVIKRHIREFSGLVYEAVDADKEWGLNPPTTPDTQHSTPYTLNPPPCTPYPIPCIPTPCPPTPCMPTPYPPTPCVPTP